MNEHPDLGPLLRTYYTVVADPSASDGQLDAVLKRTRQERQRSRRWSGAIPFAGRNVQMWPSPPRAAAVAGVGLALLGLGGLITVVGTMGTERAVSPGTTPPPAQTVPTPVPAEQGAFLSTGAAARVRECPTATTLEDGRVLVVGGWDGTAIGEAEIYDPATGQFGPAGSLLHPYFGHTATLLADGRVLIAGSATVGEGETGGDLTAEVWDPWTMTSRATGTPHYPAWSCQRPQNSRTRLLPDGRVLIESPAGDEIWDPTTGTFGEADVEPHPGVPRGTILSDGRILTIRDETEASVWDPATRSSHTAGHLSVPRRHGYFTTTLLLDGRVLVVGGEDQGRLPLAEAEIWDPATERFATTNPPLQPRSRHAAALLRDGRVLVVGSHGPGLAFPDDGTRTAEIFELGVAPPSPDAAENADVLTDSDDRVTTPREALPSLDAIPGPVSAGESWMLGGETVDLGGVPSLGLVSGVTYTSDPFRPRLEFVLSAFGNRRISNERTDWCRGRVSERLLVLERLMGCVHQVQIIRPYAVDCGTADAHPTVDELATAILANPGMVRAIDHGDLSVLHAIAPRLDLGDRYGRMIQIATRPEGFRYESDPDHCKLLPAPGSDDPAIEIRGDVDSLLILVDIEGELVVLRVSSGGYDLASGSEAVARGYASGVEILNYAQMFFDSFYDFSLDPG